jgi:hypothetical protein
MRLTWFIYSNDVSSGPFDTEVVQAKLDSGQLSGNAFIWRKGQREWMPVREWESKLPKMLEAEVAKTRKPVWYADLGTSPIGPLTQEELVSNLKGVTDLGHVRLWSAGMDNWTSLFALHDVMDLIGLTRREGLRAPLMGSVAVSRSNDHPKGFVLKAASISLGGIGISGTHDLRRGDEVSLMVKSHDFPKNIHLRGEVAYVSKTGFCGVRFVHLPAETHSLIFDFIKKFNPVIESGINAA